MHSESFASQCFSIVEGKPGLHSQQSDMEEIGNEMMMKEGIVVGTSHFDQQSFRMDLPEEESDSDQDADETDQSCNLFESLCNWALTLGVSPVALTALLPKDARTLLKTKARDSLLGLVLT
ncbi:unnamed protein product [Arctogadus glacialis]